MSASIALRSASFEVRKAAARRNEFSLLAALSKALELARQVGDTGAVNAKTVARIRQQILAA